MCVTHKETETSILGDKVDFFGGDLIQCWSYLNQNWEKFQHLPSNITYINSFSPQIAHSIFYYINCAPLLQFKSVTSFLNVHKFYKWSSKSLWKIWIIKKRKKLFLLLFLCKRNPTNNGNFSTKQRQREKNLHNKWQQHVYPYNSPDFYHYVLWLVIK